MSGLVPTPYPQPPSQPPPWQSETLRILTWLALAFFALIQVLFLVWLIWFWAGVNYDDCTGDRQAVQSCKDASNLGLVVGTFLLLGFWAMVDVIFGIAFWMLRKALKPRRQS